LQKPSRRCGDATHRSEVAEFRVLAVLPAWLSMRGARGAQKRFIKSSQNSRFGASVPA
jgi:hypothetical protein